MEKVRAKFRVNDVSPVTEGEDAGCAKVSLSPVISGSEENKTFYKWTPGGVMELSLVSQETAAFFKPGEEVYIDITKAVPSVS